MKGFLQSIQYSILICVVLTITACGSSDKQRSGSGPANTSENASADTTQAHTKSTPETSDAASAKEQQRQAKQQILNYAKTDADYMALVKTLESGEAQNSDFDSIVRVYPLTTKYSPYGSTEQAQKLLAFESMEQQNWNECLQATALILEENYTSLTGHYGAMVCYSESGNSKMGVFHNAMLDGFMGAIWRSGDGQQPATAFYITSTNDLYAFVQLNGMMATGQSLVYFEQRPIDAIKVEDPQSKQEITWYFDVTAQFRRGIFDDIESRR